LKKGQESSRVAIESRLDAIGQEYATKLDEMRQTVDEKLQTTLETWLGESFNRVVEHLERIHKGIGEMQTLDANVGDLNNVLLLMRGIDYLLLISLDVPLVPSAT
jgi:DNA recombination protein RmuC